MINIKRSKIILVIFIIILWLFLGVSFIHSYKGTIATSTSVVEVNSTLIEESYDNVQFLEWNEVNNYIFSRGTVAKVEDVYTGRKFNIIRTMGDNHADCETVTEADTQIMKEIFGGFNWSKRPILLYIDGKRYAASMAGMPHAGLDTAPAFVVVEGLSGGYGYGQNLDTIKNNNMDGVFDVHFINSRRHMEGGVSATVDIEHQKNIDIIRSYGR